MVPLSRTNLQYTPAATQFDPNQSLSTFGQGLENEAQNEKEQRRYEQELLLKYGTVGKVALMNASLQKLQQDKINDFQNNLIHTLQKRGGRLTDQDLLNISTEKNTLENWQNGLKDREKIANEQLQKAMFDKGNIFDKDAVQKNYENFKDTGNLPENGTILKLKDTDWDNEFSKMPWKGGEEYDATPRTVNGQEFWDCLKKTQELYWERTNNRVSDLGNGEGDLVVAHILTSVPDPQRGIQWPKDIGVAQKLVDSVLENSEADILIFTDFYEGDFGRVKYVKYPEGMSPLFYKFFITYDYLRRSKKYKNIFIVDSNDVEMLHNPFPHIKDITLYVGRDTPHIIKDYDWMINNSGMSTVSSWVRQADFPMVNAGIIGGRFDMVMHFLRLFIFWYMKYNGDVGERNMPLCNYIFWDKWRYKLEYGKHVTTRFKVYERTSAWWKHK